MANEKSKGSQPLSTETGQPQLDPLSSEAKRLHIKFVKRFEERKTEVENFPLTILVCGPGAKAELYQTRIDIVNALSGIHDAFMSEDITDLKSPLSIQDQVELQAEDADAVFVLCCSPGSIAEAAYFANKPKIARKMVIFLDSAHTEGYPAKGPLRKLPSGCVKYYESPSDITSGQLWREVEEWIANLQFEAHNQANQQS